jgi:hypothetical protein
MVASVATAVVFDGQPVTFGGDIDNGGLSASVVGALDELRIYDRALDAGAIRALASP